MSATNRSNHQTDLGNLPARIFDEASASLARAIGSLSEKCSDPGFRRDPACTDRYTRFDALDALSAFHDQVMDESLLQFRSRFFCSEMKLNSAWHDTSASLELIDTGQEELQALMAPLTATLDKQEQGELESLEHALSLLCELSATKLDPRGLHPSAMLRAFAAGIAPLVLRPAGKLMLCELLTEQISPCLQALYRRLHRILAGLSGTGATSHPETEPGHRRIGQEQTSRMKAGSTGIFEAAVPHRTSRERDTASADRQNDNDFDLLNLIVGMDSPGTGSTLSTYQRHQIVGALSTIQRDASFVAAGLTTERVKSRTKKILYDGGVFNAHELVEKEAAVIDFVGDIFANLLNDPTLTPTLHTLINQLQVPTIKLALLDFKLLQQPDNPARNLLGILSDLAVYATEDDDLCGKIEAIVRDLLDRFEADVTVFDTPLATCHALHEEVMARVRETERRARKAAQRRARISVARDTVRDLLEGGQSRWRIPARVAVMLHEVIGPYMECTFIEHGRDSAEWSEAVYLYQQLVVASQPQRTLEDFDVLIGSIDDLFAVIVDRVEASEPAGETWRDSVAAARRWFEGWRYRLVNAATDLGTLGGSGEGVSAANVEIDPALRTGSSPAFCADKQEDREVAPASSGKPVQAFPPRIAVTDATQGATPNLPSQVRPGTWYEIYLGEGRAKRRLKLSAVLEDSSQVMFANRTGEQELLIDLETFIDDLLSDKTRPMADNCAFDRALSAVITDIRSAKNR